MHGTGPTLSRAGYGGGVILLTVALLVGLAGWFNGSGG